MKDDDNLRPALELAEKIRVILGEKLDKVILFGSRARGDYNEHSDYDILVLDKFTDDWLERSADLRLKLRGFGHSLDLMMFNYKEYGGNLIRWGIEEDGIVLYEKDSSSGKIHN